MVSCLMVRVKSAVFFLALCVFGAETALAAEVFIDVSRQRGSQITIAVPPFVMKPSPDGKERDDVFSKLGKEVMEFDLVFSSLFSVLTDSAVIDEITAKSAPDRVSWDLWKEAKVDSLINATYYGIAKNQIAVENYLYDVDRREQLTGVRYTGLREIFRKIVHKFSDQVVYRFSGEAGVADTRIAFTAKTDGNKEIFVMDYDGANLMQITKIKSILLSPSWAPFGSKLVFTSFHIRRPDVFIMELKTGKITAIGSKIGESQSAPEWSADGKMIAFCMSTDGNSDIYTIGADGKGLKRLTSDSSIETSPTWSPDGKRIAYVSDIAGKPQIYIMDADGGNKERFTFNGDYNADPAWSPKGDRIAYASMIDWRFNIVVKTLDGLIEKQVTADNAKNTHPSWSPDGRHIAFSSTRSGTSQIYIMNTNGNNQIRVTNISGGASSPAWSPRN